MAQLTINQPQARELLALLEQAAATPELLAVRENLAALSWISRSCPACGREFEPATDRRITCSDRCRQVVSRSRRGLTLLPLAGCGAECPAHRTAGRLESRIERMRRRATPARLQALAAALAPVADSAVIWSSEQAGSGIPAAPADRRAALRAVLLEVGVTTRWRLRPPVQTELLPLLPAADPSIRDPLFWAAALRLGGSVGEPPATAFELLVWAGLRQAETAAGRRRR